MTLNQLFSTDEKIDKVKDLIRDGDRIPKRYKNFKVNDEGYLVYTPLDLIVVPKAEIEALLTNLYENDVNMLAKGIKNVYKYVSSQYMNITRQEVENFLTKQKEFQLSGNVKQVVNKPIIEKKPNARWQIDLIDMENYKGSNRGKIYILNCVDVFSRKLWLRALRNKASQTTADALQSILDEVQVTPSVVQTDGGTEFKDAFDTLLKTRHIFHLVNPAYTPNENAIVERSNREVRKVIRTLMLADSNFVWYDKLDIVENHRNNAYNETIKTTPNTIWSPDKLPIDPDEETGDNTKLVARVNAIKSAIQKIKKYKQKDDFKVGDIVRVKMSSIFNYVRDVVKSKNTKQLVVTYTPSTFEIIRKIKKTGVLERNKYLLLNSKGEFVRKKDGKGRKNFYASDLVLVEGARIAESKPDEMAEALRLNKVTTNENDDKYDLSPPN